MNLRLLKQVFIARRASLLFTSTLLSVTAFAACGDDVNPGSPATTPPLVDGGRTPGTDAQTPVVDAQTPVVDAQAPVIDARSPVVDGGPSDPGAAQSVRSFIDKETPGGLAKLKVPATDSEIPLPPAPAPAVYAGRFDTTEAKRFLGKLIFHDPGRTARVNANDAQPLDFPRATAFGGTIGVTDGPNGAPPAGMFANAKAAQIDAIVASTRNTGSCGSCHIGEAAGKAGQLINFNTGGEGRGYTDAKGVFIPRRRPQASLIKLRNTPLFPGDVLSDALPTLTDIFRLNGERIVTTPALFYHNIPAAQAGNLSIIQSGRLDQLDSVGRLSPSMVGFAFNNRLLFGGFAGEPHETIGSLQPPSILLDPPYDDPAQENLTFLLLDAHRMLGSQNAVLQAIPAFVQAFKEAFPAEAAEAALPATTASPKPVDRLINDFTVARATTTFLRATAVTRNTPFDKFLAGDDTALTASQLRGAKLFFTKATDGGANCVACHSGPMLNKQPNDPDLAGIGQFVDENFVNVGIGDHPVQALNAAARGHATAYHAEDTGREEVTHRSQDLFRFRSLTMRQLKDAHQFFHNGSLTSVRDVVAYFNAGLPQDPTAGASATLDPRFTSPRGAGTTGLGLTGSQMDDIADFVEDGLFDVGFKDAFNLSADDLNFTGKHPSLKAAGATDGVLLSGSANDDNDPLSRRDQGLAFLNVTDQTSRVVSTSGNKDTWVITNTGSAAIDTHLLVVVTNIASGVTVAAKESTANVARPGGIASGEPVGEPYYRLYLPDGILSPGQSISVDVTRTGGTSDSYTLKVLSGQGTP